MAVVGWLVKCEAVEWIDKEFWPPVVRVRLVDVDGREWLFDDKVLIFWTPDGLGIALDTELPASVAIGCSIVEELSQEVVQVEIDGGRPEAHDGTTRFRVRRGQLFRSAW